MQIALQQTQVRLTAAVDPASAELGKPVKATGLLEQSVNGVWIPLPGKTIDVELHSEDPSAGIPPYVAALTTGQDGRVSAQLVAQTFMWGIATFNVNGDYDFFFNAARADLKLRILQKMSFTDVPWVWRLHDPARPNTWGVAAFIDDTVPLAGWRTVEFQISHDGKTAWQTVTSARPVWDSTQRAYRYTAELTADSGGFLRAYTAQNEYTFAGTSGTVWLPEPPGPRVMHRTPPQTTPVPRLP